MLNDINIFAFLFTCIAIATGFALVLAKKKRLRLVLLVVIIIALLVDALGWLIVEQTRINLEAGERAIIKGH